MFKKPRLIIILLRVAMGWLFLYQGLVAMMNSSWSIAPYIQNPVLFQSLYNTILSPGVLPLASLIVKIIYIVVGGFLILGLFVRIASLVGAVLMLFFYFPHFVYPYIGAAYYIVDEHVIYALVLLFLLKIRAGEYFGLGTMFKFSRY